MVPGIIVLVGKVAFLAALYGFLYAVFRGLVAGIGAERREAVAVAPQRARAGAPPVPEVERYELRPPTVGAVTLHAPPSAAAARSVAEALAETAPAVPAELRPSAPAGAPEEKVAPAPDLAPPATTPPIVPGPELVLPLAEPAPDAAAPVLRPRPAKLVVLSAPEAGLSSGQAIALMDVLTIGRSPDNDLVLSDRFVSSRHAEVLRQGQHYVLRDLGSTNGTTRNGARVAAECVLSDGDRIGLGTSVFAFREG